MLRYSFKWLKIYSLVRLIVKWNKVFVNSIENNVICCTKRIFKTPEHTYYKHVVNMSMNIFIHYTVRICFIMYTVKHTNILWKLLWAIYVLFCICLLRRGVEVEPGASKFVCVFLLKLLHKCFAAIRIKLFLRFLQKQIVLFFINYSWIRVNRKNMGLLAFSQL